MKQISAIIRPYLLEDVRQSLAEFGRAVSISEVKTFDPRPVNPSYRGGEAAQDFVPQIRLDIVVPDAQVERAVRIIRSAALTGHHGDGSIWVTAVQSYVRIRTGEVECDEPKS